MKSEELFKLFTKVDSLEDCPCGRYLLVWDGCEYRTTYVDIDVDTGCNFDPNYPDVKLPFVAYIELPTQDESMKFLGDVE